METGDDETLRAIAQKYLKGRKIVAEFRIIGCCCFNGGETISDCQDHICDSNIQAKINISN